MKRLLVFSFIVTIFFWGGYSEVTCVCNFQPLRTEIRSIPFIVSGKSVNLLDRNTDKNRSLQTSFTASFLITNIYKGNIDEDTIVINSHYTNCDFKFYKDTTYLLFLIKEEGSFYVKPCSYSSSIKLAEKKVLNKVERICRRRKY